jgi:hypothetical protein
MSETKDLCLNCGAEHASELWGANCGCGNSNVVHQQACNGCWRIVGQITDDDYCGPEKLYCPDCMDKARNKTPNVEHQGPRSGPLHGPVGPVVE